MTQNLTPNPNGLTVIVYCPRCGDATECNRTAIEHVNDTARAGVDLYCGSCDLMVWARVTPRAPTYSAAARMLAADLEARASYRLAGADPDAAETERLSYLYTTDGTRLAEAERLEDWSYEAGARDHSKRGMRVRAIARAIGRTLEADPFTARIWRQQADAIARDIERVADARPSACDGWADAHARPWAADDRVLLLSWEDSDRPIPTAMSDAPLLPYGTPQPNVEPQPSVAAHVWHGALPCLACEHVTCRCADDHCCPCTCSGDAGDAPRPDARRALRKRQTDAERAAESDRRTGVARETRRLRRLNDAAAERARETRQTRESLALYLTFA